MADESEANRTTLLQLNATSGRARDAIGESYGSLTLSRIELANEADDPAASSRDTRPTNRPRAPDPTAMPETEPAEWLREGDQIGRFQIVGPLGRGGTGTVYEALDTATGLSAAVKVLHRLLAPRLVGFKSEFRLASRLAHPNLVTPYELALDQGRWFMAMELVRGGDFLARVRPRASGVLDEPELRRALLGVLDGLATLHAANIIHRDLKPSNVLIDAQGCVRIVDFGLAQLEVPGHAWLDEQGRVVGTPAYMAPEQAAGERVTAAADLYGVGMMLFEALTGRWPFEGPIYGVLMQKMSCNPPDVRELVEGVPEDLAKLANRLLAREPSARPSLEEVRGLLGASTAVPLPPRFRSGFALIGRSLELVALQESFEGARQGRVTVVHVEGSSGVGKSALVAAFARKLVERGALVLSGRCHELESIPHKGLDAVVDSLRGYLRSLSADALHELLPADFAGLVEMFPVLADVAPASLGAASATAHYAERERAYTALSELLARLARELPVVIALDDAHWGDLDGARLLAHVLAFAAAAPLLFVFSFRGEEAATSPFLRHLSQAGVAAWSGARRVALGPLPLEAAAELAHSLLETRDPEAAARIAAEAAGEPFLVEQLALHAADASGARDLHAVISARASRLGPEALRMLETVALAAQPIPEHLAGLCAGLADGRAQLAQLASLSLLRRSADGNLVYPYHDRIRDALVRALPAARQRELCFELARLGEQERLLPASALADYYERAGAAERAALHAFEAGTLAARALAFELAADMFARTQRLAHADRELARRARVERAHCLHRAGRCAEAGEAYLLASDDAGVSERLALRSRAVDAWLACGRVDTALQILGPLLEAAGSSYPTGKLTLLRDLVGGALRAKLALTRAPIARAQLEPAMALRSDLLWDAGKGLLAIAPPEGAALAFRSTFCALASGDAHRMGRSLAFLGSGFVPLLERESGRFLRWAEALAERNDDQHLRLMLLIARSARGLLTGKWQESVDAAEQVLALAPHTPVATAWEQAMAHTLLVSSLEYQGELAAMEHACLRCLRQVRARGDQITAVTVVSAHGYTRAAQHDAAGLDALTADMELAMQGWTVSVGLWDFYNLRLRVLRALCWGDARAAHVLVEEAWPRLRRHQLLRMPVVRGPALILRTAVLLGLGAQGRRAERAKLRRLIAALEADPRPDSHVHAATARALRLHDAGEERARDQLLERAAHAARAADLRVVYRMIERLRARLAGRASDELRLEGELAGQGVAEAAAWARFVTPGWSDHA